MAKIDRDGVPKRASKRKTAPVNSDFWNGDRGGFAAIPRRVLDGPDFMALNGGSIKLLLEFARQVNGHNNGDLTAAWSILNKRGFASKDTIERSIKELIQRGLIVKTRQGQGGVDGKRQPTLYALTWLAICPINTYNGNGRVFDVEPTTQPLRRSYLDPYDGRALTTPNKNSLLTA
ncbi:hypothetical protein [Oceanisphaera pacifica]|uniref:Helix-turn-helix domain-containing protein n=1 Tax=Oceanisphaera pacifica TaxID=2818389 RepID=A0ABS3NCB8_9GAMM|nr:hypothetical protein [Oceanisphaera pacifica]MBO1518241.1 hypothetical protein [Oceanisphaera pacifica]